MFDPSSPLSKAISDLFNITMAIGAVILALITALVIYALVKYRRKPGDNTEPTQVTGNNKLEIGWTIAPVVVLAVLLVLTLFGIANADPGIPEGKQAEVEVIGHQWWWEYRYPTANGTVYTANEVHIPTGKRLLFKYQSADVIHDFWVPQLGRKMDAMVEYPNYSWIQADKPGEYLGACSEYCGTQHAGMLIKVFAQSQAEFDNWLKQQAVVPPAPTAEDQKRGADLFQKATCVTCHNISGTAANARVAPDLTHMGSRSTIGSGVVPNTPENLTRWIRNASSLKPGVNMPAYQFTDQELHDLVAYLEALK